MSLTVRYYDVPQVSGLQAEQSGGQPFSAGQDVLEGGGAAAYATLEQGCWVLDGSRVLLPEEPKGFWWSAAVSDGVGEFAVPPVITLEISQVVTATGLSFVFWPETEQWCSRMRLTWLQGSALLAQEEVYPDSPRWILPKTVEGFDRVRIELLQTNRPGQFAKLQNVELGQVWEFGKDALVSVELLEEMDPLLCDLPVDTTKVVLRNKTPAVLLPQEDQKLVLYRDAIPLATHFIRASSREEKNLYTLEGHSVIGVLDSTFLGGMYRQIPVETLLEQILQGREYSLAEVYRQQTVNGYLPVCTCREALQQLAFALGAVVKTDGNGVICLRPLESDIKWAFTPAQIFRGGKVRTDPRYARVELTAHSYGEIYEEKVLLEEEPIYGTAVLLTFDKPYHSYRVTGGTLVENAANYIRVTASGPVTVIGYPYSHHTTVYSRSDPRSIQSERGNMLQVERATLINNDNAEAVLERLYQTCQMRQELDQDVVVSGQRVGQRVAAPNPWGTQTRGVVTTLKSRLTQQGQVAQLRVLGMEAPAQTVYLYSGEGYAGEKGVL